MRRKKLEMTPQRTQTRSKCFTASTVYCFCVSQKPACKTLSVMADNLILFFTLWCAKASHFFLNFSHFRTKAKWGLEISSPNPRAQTAGPAVWCSTNDWVFLSEISSGRPLFPPHVDTEANKKLRKRGAPVCKCLSELNSHCMAPRYFQSHFLICFMHFMGACYDSMMMQLLKWESKNTLLILWYEITLHVKKCIIIYNNVM